jgi:hypothetical protein
LKPSLGEKNANFDLDYYHQLSCLLFGPAFFQGAQNRNFILQQLRQL